MKAYRFLDSKPLISPKAKIHSTAVVIGDVEIDEYVSVWPYAVIRGDVDKIKIAKNSNIQDLVVIHPNKNRPVIIGEGVTVGHSAVVHGSIVGNNCLIGMNATIIDCEIGDNSLVAAGCVVIPQTKIPPCSLVAGVPGKVIKNLDERYVEEIKKSADEYLRLFQMYEEF
ncbi:MAG: gamma carbonic anhydrase family protein [Elusimicrobiales bacterium]